MRFFQTLTGSFHSAALYRTVRREGDMRLGYALGVVMLCTLVLTIYFTVMLHRAVFVGHAGKVPLFDDIITQIADQLPVMTVDKQQVQTKEPVATDIKIHGEAFGEEFHDITLMTIDTTGNTTHENMKTPMVFTSHEMIYKTEREVKIEPYSKLLENMHGPMVINHAVAQDLGAQVIAKVHANLFTFYLIFGVLGWLMYAALEFIGRLIMLLVLGLVGLMLGSLLKSPLSYSSAVGLAAVSFTPVALLQMVLTFTLIYSPHTLSLLIAGIGVLTAAISCSRGANTPPAMIG